MTAAYGRAVLRLRWLLDALEHEFAGLGDGAHLSYTHMQFPRGAPRPATRDEWEVAVQALSTIGVVDVQDGQIKLNQAGLARTENLRMGVRLGLDAAATQGEVVVQLAVVGPSELPPAVLQEFSTEVPDLRAALWSLIASAERRAVLISPFWDRETCLELGDLLERRLEAGVQVQLLGRKLTSDRHDGFAALIGRLRHFPRFEAYTWFRRDATSLKSQTFHLKSTVIDDGARAYLGTANFTTASLRSQFELGAILAGPPAAKLSRVADRILTHLASIVAE